MPRIPAKQAEQQPDKQLETKAEPAKQPPKAKPVHVIERRIETVMLAVPLGEIGNGHRQSHVEAWLKPTQAETMQRLLLALRDKRETNANGREVKTAADAFRWLLEQMAEPC